MRTLGDTIAQAQGPGAGFVAVQIAGEPERRARAAREREGIWLDVATWGEIVEAGHKVGVAVG